MVKMQTGGWFKLDDSWYYIQSNGARRFSELSEIGGKKYLFAADGKMLTGHQVYNGKKRCSLAKVVHSKQQVSLQHGKRLIQIGISMMRMG